MPQVSVLMSVFNGERYLPEAINSILAQTFRDFELIVVDDGSTDSTADILREYAQGDSRLRLLRHEVNQGQAAALNWALGDARGSFIATMDADDISAPHRLERQVEFLRSHPDIGAVGTNRKVCNHDMSELLYTTRLPSRHALLALNSFIGYIFLGATLMFRSEFAPAIGGSAADGLAQIVHFEPRLRVATRARFACLEEPLYLYRRHADVRPKGPGSAVQRRYLANRKRLMEILGHEAPEQFLGRLEHLRQGGKLSWNERRKIKRDLIRLANSLVAAEWVEPGDEALLMAAINRRLEEASPRLWQKFCYWRRHRLPWLFPDSFGLYE